MSCEIEQLERVYRLTYRFGNQAPTSKQFRFKGNLEEATTRARKHCKTMGYVYIFTSPFVVDLDHQEESKLKDASYEPHTRR